MVAQAYAELFGPHDPRQWLQQLALEVGLPIDPPDRNVNSRFALQTAELVRAKRGDGAAGVFHHYLSRAFFAKGADISKPDVVFPIAESYGALRVGRGSRVAGTAVS